MSTPDLNAMFRRAESGEEFAEVARLEAEANGGPFYPVEPPKPSRTDRYLARVDADLASFLSDRARHVFLMARQAEMEARFARFLKTNGRSEPIRDPLDPPQAADFRCSIDGLAARRIAVQERMAKERDS